MVRRSIVTFLRRVIVASVALALTAPLMAGRAGAAADSAVDIYWSAGTRSGTAVIGHIPRGTTTTSFLYSNLAGAQAIATDGTDVYWSSPNVIWRAPLNGSGTPEQFLSGTFEVQAMAIDSRNELLYMADSVSSSIGRTILLPNQPVTTLVKTPGVASGLALDTLNGYLYWAQDNTASIGRAKVVDTSTIVAEPNFLTGLEGAEGVAVDGTYVYWANDWQGIGRAPVDSSTAPNGSFVPSAKVSLSATATSTPMAVNGEYIYWVNHSDYAIGQVPITGGTADNTFVRTLVDPTGLVLQAPPAHPGPLPPPPPPTVSTLRTGVDLLGLPHGTERSLLAKVDAAQRALDSGDTAGACASLTSLANALTAQRGKKIEEPSVLGLVGYVQTLRQSLGCTR